MRIWLISLRIVRAWADFIKFYWVNHLTVQVLLSNVGLKNAAAQYKGLLEVFLIIRRNPEIC